MNSAHLHYNTSTGQQLGFTIVVEVFKVLGKKTAMSLKSVALQWYVNS